MMSYRTRSLVYTSPEVRFVEDGHRYYINDGRSEERWISPTQALDLCGIGSDYSMVPGVVLARAAQRGRAVHKALPLLLAGNLDWSTVDDAIVGYVEQLALALDELHFEPWNIEEPVASHRLRCAGTPDGWGLALDKPTIIDLKTAPRNEERAQAASIQTALYADAVQEAVLRATGIVTQPDRLVVWLQPSTFHLEHPGRLSETIAIAEAVVRVAWLKVQQQKRREGAR